MSNELKYCMGCMRSIPDDTVICPHCSYNEEETQIAPYLQKGSILFGKYLVGKVLGTNPDKITYIGADIKTGETVTVYEFFPENLVMRNNDGYNVEIINGYESLFSEALSEFLELWNTVNTFKDAHCLPDVLEIFDYNSTVYTVCLYKDCISLRQYFQNSNPLTWERTFSAFKPIMYALKKLNQTGLVHCKLTPDTIHVGADGKLHITGFSISRCYNGTPEFILEPTPGFAPIELYHYTGRSAATDVYSITALLYYSITGITPPSATDRVIQDTTTLPAAVSRTLSPNVITGLINGLSVYSHNRYSNFDELISVLTPPNAKAASVSGSYSASDMLDASKKEEVDMEIAREEKAKEHAQIEKKKKSSSVWLGIQAFLSGFIICAIAFCVLYVTVLYKDHPIDILDKALSYITFLPMNQKEDETTTLPTATKAPVATEPRYITVADFVNSLNYDSIVNNSFFTENYNIKFEYRESADTPAGGILSQSLEAGTSVLAGSDITLIVSLGIKMPDVRNKNYKQAQEILEGLGLKVDIQLIQNENKSLVGIVANTNTPVGTSLKKGDTVTINVWGKVATTTTTTTKPSTTAPSTSASDSSTTQDTATKPVTESQVQESTAGN